MPENIVQTAPVATYTTTHQHPPHTTIHFYILIGFNIQKHFLRRLVTCAIKYCTKPTCQNLYYYTHARFTCHHTLLHTTIFLHHTDLIQKYIPSCRIIFPLVESEKVDSNINSKFLCTRTRWTSYLDTKGIYYFYSLLVILIFLLSIFFYAHTFLHSLTLFIYIFTRLCEVLITYF